jgi:glucosylceramidase
VFSYPLSILGDRAASKYVDGTAFHLYGGEASVLTHVHDAYPNKNLYMTEQSVTARRGEGPLGIAEPVRRVMIGATRNWSRNVLLWNLAADPQNGPHTNNGGCTGLTPEDKVVLVVSNTGNFLKTFAVKYHGKVFQTVLPAESVGTYVW